MAIEQSVRYRLRREVAGCVSSSVAVCEATAAADGSGVFCRCFKIGWVCSVCAKFAWNCFLLVRVCCCCFLKFLIFQNLKRMDFFKPN